MLVFLKQKLQDIHQLGFKHLQAAAMCKHLCETNDNLDVIN